MTAQPFSTAVGGIKFNDGTIQTTAAAGGGGGDEEFNPSGDLSTYGYTNHVLGWQYLTHVHTIATVSSGACFFIPFYAPITGPMTTLKIATAGSGATIRAAIYSSDANDMPVAPISSVSTDWTSVTATVVSNSGNWFDLNTATPASAPSVTRGEKYWVGITTNAPSSVAGRESVCSFFLDNTYADWYSAGASDPGTLLHYLNTDSGASAGNLPATVTVADLQNSTFAGFEIPLVTLEI